mmetsp:Transcript_15597/g.23624  ORF Transcript_15597/g.23624 Transcript_15597/m.23624 type:complete len:441 (+) Transcript_15597:82-1404(+)
MSRNLFVILILFTSQSYQHVRAFSSHPFRKIRILHQPTKPNTVEPLNLIPQHKLTPLIAADDSWGNWSFLSGMAILAQVFGESTRVGRLLGPPVSAMALTFFFASTGILNPGGTAPAKSLQFLSLQIATPMLLLGADLRDCIPRCGPLLGAFAWASIATIAACSVGWCACGSLLTKALGSDALIIAAALMAKNVGGGINYVAVCRCLSASPEAFAAGLCVDNIFGLLYFPVTSALAAGMPDVKTSFVTNDLKLDHRKKSKYSSITIKEVSLVIWIAATLIWLGERFGGTSGSLPLCTLLTVFLASLAPRKFIQPLQPASYMLGSCALYHFFATAGAPGLAVAESVKAALIPLGLFLTLLYGIHGAFLFLCYKVKGPKGGFAPQRLLVASSAAIGGPATAVALAQASGWKSLIAPSLLVGNIGYAVATFAGIGYYKYFSTF